MKTKINYSILIQKYLGDELDAPEVSKFEHLFKNDDLLAAELKLQISVDQAVSDPSLENFKIYLEKLHNKHLGDKLGNRPLGFNSYLALVAAMLMLLTFGSVFIYDNFKAKSSAQYFEEYYKPYDITIVSRNQNSDLALRKDVFKLIHYYNIGDFETAGQILTTYKMDTCSDNRQLIMMSGVIHLELNHFDLAKEEFNKILTVNDALFKQDASWYLGLTYLKAKEINQSKIVLNKIVEENSFYSEKASKLLLKLK